MPFYEYQCKNCGHALEAMQKVSDSPLKKCPHCGKSQLQRLMSAPVFRLKGSGWYETDFKGDSDSKRNLADRPEADAKDSDAKPKEDKAKDDAKATDAKASDGASGDASGKDKVADKKPDKAATRESKSADSKKSDSTRSDSSRSTSSRKVNLKSKQGPKKSTAKPKRRR